MKGILFRSRNRTEERLALALILLGVFSRLLPHPENFTPTAALALFAGTVLPPAWALTVPLAMMVLSDLFLGLHSLFWLVWVFFSLVALFGGALRSRAGVGTVVFATLGSSLLFFVVSNLGVFFVDRLYPRTFDGLVQCFTMALPFFKNSFLGDVFYSTVLFGGFELTRNRVRVPA